MNSLNQRILLFKKQSQTKPLVIINNPTVKQACGFSLKITGNNAAVIKGRMSLSRRQIRGEKAAQIHLIRQAERQT